MINGIINVYKEKGYTSHDVVARLRGILKQKKIGHTGTLDPDAEGVLPVCLGKGTKLCDMLTDTDKIYKAVLLLGTVTDTQDISGTILSKKPVSVSKQAVCDAVYSFIGAYEQIPPMYSAIKVGGRKLYELARAGKVIERKLRHIRIANIDITDYEVREDAVAVTFLVTCSKGTYIRTLCHDIGEKLGCGGCMEGLVRMKVGNLEISTAMKLDTIDKLWKTNQLEGKIIRIEDMLKDYPKVYVKENYSSLLRNGNQLKSEYLKPDDIHLQDNETVRVYDGKELIGIYCYDMFDKQLKVVKMF